MLSLKPGDVIRMFPFFQLTNDLLDLFIGAVALAVD
jgi:hypothetical protein